MKKHFYLCGDKKAYKFALENYADKNTEITFCKMTDEIDRALQFIFKNLRKDLYIFGHCRTGYFKVKLKTYLTLDDNTFDGFYIPYNAKKSRNKGKPQEQYIKGIVDGDCVIQIN